MTFFLLKFKNVSECVSSPVVLLYTSPGLVEEQDPAGELEHHPEHVHGVDGRREIVLTY